MFIDRFIMGRIYLCTQKNGSDEVSDGNQIRSDTFQNGSDIIRYPTVILSPEVTLIRKRSAISKTINKMP